MERWQIIVIAVVASIIWMIYKRRTGRTKSTFSGDFPKRQTVESWYRLAQEKAADLEAEIKTQKEKRWSEMSQEQQLAYTESFLETTFGSLAKTKYSTDEKLQLGKTQFLIEMESGPIQ